LSSLKSVCLKSGVRSRVEFFQLQTQVHRCDPAGQSPQGVIPPAFAPVCLPTPLRVTCSFTMAETPHPSGLSDQAIAELRRLARLAAENSYSPYSKFRVGAAVLLEDGQTFSGCNIENASYRLTICAEHSAIACAIAQLGPKIRVRAVAVENLNNADSMPCGACRQILLEFGGPTLWVFGPAREGPVAAPLSELLPHWFELDHEN
jgi:cytidine deaminase